MAAPRAIRIPRPSAANPRPATTVSPSSPEPPPEKPPKLDLRQNQAALERAHRLAIIFLGTLVVLYAAFVLLDRSAPGGTSTTAATGMLYFTAIAVALGIGGAWVALVPVPRAVEVHADHVIIIESWGYRRRFPSIDEIRVLLVHRYPRSILSSRAVLAVEVTDEIGHRRTYQIEEGLLPDLRPGIR